MVENLFLRICHDIGRWNYQIPVMTIRTSEVTSAGENGAGNFARII
jgi:hypothetical protein